MAWKFEAWTPEERQIAFKSQMNLFWVGIMAQQFVWSLLFFASMFGLNFGKIENFASYYLKLQA